MNKYFLKPRKNKQIMTEHNIQYSIIEYLLLNKITVIGLDVMSGLQYFSQSDQRRFSFINHHKKMGYKKGQADFLMLLPQRTIFVEAKTKKGKQSHEQIEFEIEVKARGHEYLVWNCFEDQEKFIKDVKEDMCLVKIV